MHNLIEDRLKKFKKRLDYEIVEPAWGWGLRVAIAVILPSSLSIYTQNHDYFWMIVAAETVSIVELKGSAGKRIRLLVAAIMFAILSTILGSIIGLSPLFAILFMFPLAFATGLMKNLGDWGLALALNIYLFYLIASNQPSADVQQICARALYVASGGIWAMLVGVFSFSFLPQGRPYRRTIANIWLAVEQLVQLVGDDWDTKKKKSSIRALYLKEKDVRKAIDESIAQFELLYDSKISENSNDKKLSYARRCAAIASLQIVSIANISNQFRNETIQPLFRTTATAMLRVLEQIANRMAFYLYTLKEEELLLIYSRLNRLEQLKSQLSLLPESNLPSAQNILMHVGRFDRLVHLSLASLSNNKERKIYQQYSLLQTLNILHPKYLINNFRQFINFDNLTLKYGLRMAVAAMLSYWIGTIYTPEHSYWMPLTTIIVTQPFFGATLKRGFERSIGTVAGVLIGGLILMAPFAQEMRYALIFFGAIFMIYNLRKNYAWAAFFISLFLMGLMSNGEQINGHLITERIVATIVGAAISIIIGFILFPTWDKKLLPQYLTKAVIANYKYFTYLFYEQESNIEKNWVHFKIDAESANSNAYDSLNRYNTEPTIKQENLTPSYFTSIAYNIRITRELNFYQDDTEAEEIKTAPVERDSVIPLLNNIHNLFKQVIQLLEQEYHIAPNIDWTANKNRKNDLQPSENQWQCLERLYIELKALYTGMEHSRSIAKKARS